MANNEERNMDGRTPRGRFDLETERRLKLLSDVYALIGLEKAAARQAAYHDLASLGLDSAADFASERQFTPIPIPPVLPAHSCSIRREPDPIKLGSPFSGVSACY